MTSKSQHIINTRDELLAVFNAYASLAAGWNINDEDDYADLEDAIDEVLERNIDVNQL